MKTAKRLEGIGEYYFSQKLREIDEMNKQGKNVISLGIGSPDLPPHPSVIKALQEEAVKPNQHGYQSYKGSPIFRTAIAKWYNKWYDVTLNPDTEILPLIGSKEGIMHICMTYINEGDLVLIPNPGYPTYRSAAKISGGVCVEYNLEKKNSWFPDFLELQQIIRVHKSMQEKQGGEGRNVLMFVNYPQMPTGQLPTKELFEKLIHFAQRNGVILVHDNPYSFILNDNPMSILSVVGAKEVALELNSLSKSHNMAGWRVGMLCGAQDKINDVLRFKSNMDSGMFLPVQLAAAKALELEQDWHDEVNKVYAQRRKKVFELLHLLNCNFDEDQAGLFVWASIPPHYKDGFELSDEVLHKSNVFITPGGIFGSAGNNYVRVSLCSTEEKIEEAIKRIKN
ncbi:pyridoxal phosphate-dependent aminotransferase [Ferruginibacter sp. SUN002]|uniref:pyridoxal phosphate-dependent aminotransferase n=1 Tax=Ferruginibacter sp. SUN002 TaxID=2937789 RepID=UPI003D36073E